MQSSSLVSRPMSDNWVTCTLWWWWYNLSVFDVLLSGISKIGLQSLCYHLWPAARSPCYCSPRHAVV